MFKSGIIFIYGAGVYNLLLALYHIYFWSEPVLNWKEELGRLSPINSGIMQVLNLCLTAFFFIMAIVSFLHADELMSTSLGVTILVSLTIFWLLRLIYQFIFWEYSGLMFPVMFATGFLLYLIPALFSIIEFKQKLY